MAASSGFVALPTMSYLNTTATSVGVLANTTDTPPSTGKVIKLELYVVLVMLAVFSFVGTVGNALVVYVFSKKNDNQTSTIFMLALAVVDMVICMVVLPGTMFMEYNDFFTYSDVFCKIYMFLTTSNVPYSAFIMTAIAIDRYLCICHPFLHIMTVPRARIFITCLFILAGILGIFAAWLHSCYETKHFSFCYNVSSIALYNATDMDLSVALNNLTEVSCQFANETDVHVMERSKVVYSGLCGIDLGLHDPQAVSIIKYVHLSTFPLCILVVSVLYTMIYKSVLDRRRKRAKMKQSTARIINATEKSHNVDTEETRLATATVTVNGNNETKHTLTVETPSKLKRKSTRKDRNRMQNMRTAMMLFIVTIAFIVSFLPASLMIIEVFDGNVIVFNLYFANNVVNPVIYSFMNKNFRDDLKKVFNCS